MNLLKLFSKKEKVAPPKFVISEGIAGMYYYHISKSGEGNRQSLCGKQTMITSIPLGAWGLKTSHIPRKYCENCKELMDKEQ